MNSSSVFRTTCIVVVLLAAALADDSSTSTYQKGTLTKNVSPQHKSYDLKVGNKLYQINNCGDFQDGQTVDFRVKDNKVYIAHDGGKEYKCSIEAKTADVPPPPTFQKGTIEGYEVRHDTSVWGGTNSNSVGSYTRNAKVYELHGADFIYKVDYCGSFQAGQFSAGQVVEYRVEGDRLYIRHDNNKEYSCQVEGKRAPDNTKPPDPPAPASPSPSSQ